MAEVGVDVVGEIERGRTFGQIHHLPLRREGIDAIGKGFRFELVKDYVAARGIAAAVKHAPQPVDLLLKLAAVARAFFFV